MRLNDALQYAFDHVRDGVHRTVDGLTAEQLVWRPAPDANTTAWLVWHLTRVVDDHVAEIAGVDQCWTQQPWAQRFGLPADAMDTGYGHTAEQVGGITPAGADVLGEYHDAVAAMVSHYLDAAPDDDFDRIIDWSYDPPVSVGVRLMSASGDALQHLGQAAYLRGLLRS